MHHLAAAAVGHRDRHDEVDAVGDLREIWRIQLGTRPQRRRRLLQVLHRLGPYKPSARLGSIRTTCGSTEAKYGTRAIAAAEGSRVPPGRRKAAAMPKPPFAIAIVTADQSSASHQVVLGRCRWIDAVR